MMKGVIRWDDLRLEGQRFRVYLWSDARYMRKYLRQCAVVEDLRRLVACVFWRQLDDGQRQAEAHFTLRHLDLNTIVHESVHIAIDSLPHGWSTSEEEILCERIASVSATLYQHFSGILR